MLDSSSESRTASPRTLSRRPKAAPKAAKVDMVFRIPGCLARHREEFLAGLLEAEHAGCWKVIEKYDRRSIKSVKLRLSTAELDELEAIHRRHNVFKRQVVTAALHCAARSRLSRTYVADCRAANKCGSATCPAALSH